MIQITILGSGTSSGVPLIGCLCKVCRSKNPRNHRLRASAWIQIEGKSILIDTSTDLRQQALREKIPRVDAVLYTHPHADHISGIDELRSYNFIQKDTIPLYGNDWTISDLRERFPYIFSPQPVEGGGIPQLELNLIPPGTRPFQIKGVKTPFIPLPVRHGSQSCLGFRLAHFAYITDCHEIPNSTVSHLFDLDALVLDCVKLAPHATHFNLDQALSVISKVKPRRAYLTHLGHDFDHVQWKRKLPKGVSLAYDRLKIKTPNH